MNANPFDSEEFDHICYRYRMAPCWNPDEVASAFEAVKEFGRQALANHVSSKTDTDRGE